MKTARRIHHTYDFYIFAVLKYSLTALVALICLAPFYIIVVSSFTSEHYIIVKGYSLIPHEISLAAYKLIFQSPQRILNAYKISTFITIAGTFCSLLFSSMGAYVMYRKDVKYRNQLAFFLFFTTLFNGGLLPYYLLVARTLGMRNTILPLLLCPMFNVVYILILRNFLNVSVPQSLIEAAQIDGCNDFSIFFRIVLPLLKPGLASIGFFVALGYWNDWWNAMMFVDTQVLQPLQYILWKILANATFASTMVGTVPMQAQPQESLKLALTVVATGPIVLLYPFVQRFFVSGMTIGSVKG